MSLYTFACIKAGLEGKAGSAHRMVNDDLDGVLAFARKNRSAVKVWWPSSADMILALANGDVAAGNMHSPEYLAAMRERPALAASVPDEDRALVQVFWSIPAGSANHRLAEDAINVLFSEGVQLGFARRGMATPLPGVAERMAKEDALWGSLYPHTAEQFRTLRYYPYEAYAARWDEVSDAWDRTVLAAG
jgi:spermidine/putrescine-binding protein